MFCLRITLGELLAVASASPLVTRDNEKSMPFDFANIPVIKEIDYIPCFENFTCTYLEVPLDYANESAGTTNISFMKWSSPKQPAKGDLIYNPGGPAESPIASFLSEPTLKMLIHVLGDEYNLIAREPRGVNNNAESKSDLSVRKYFAAAGGFGDWCSKQLGDEACYANTPAVASDMLRYAEMLAEIQGQPIEESKVNFFGLLLGKWSEQIHQADDVMEAYIDTCFEIKEKCPFYRNDSNADAIRGRIEAIFNNIETNPVVVTDGPVAFPVLYSFQGSFGTWGKILAAAEICNLSGIIAPDSRWIQKGLVLPGPAWKPAYLSNVPRIVLACNDNMGRGNISTVEELKELYETNKGISKWTGDIWTQVIMPQCRNLRFVPPGSQKIPELKKVKTSTPILFVNNILDPVTSSQSKSAQFFENSAILLQDAWGHGITVAPSKCMSEHIARYLADNELPQPKTLCPIDVEGKFL